jgi:DNA invertase Pin-like site-specific DNA recombinase
VCKLFVAYYRVSTEKQGRSGLGLQAQQEAVRSFIATKGAADAKLIAAYTEVESGKRDDRPQLMAAMAQAELTGACLLIAKLDRLSRDAHFLLGLQKAGIDFTACDMPHADRFTVGIMALVAQKEREAISERTKAALAAARARGVQPKEGRPLPRLDPTSQTGYGLGSPKGAAHLHALGTAHAVAGIKAKADDRAASLCSTIAAIEARGITSARAIAKALNEAHIATPRGGIWTARSVINVKARQ